MNKMHCSSNSKSLWNDPASRSILPNRTTWGNQAKEDKIESPCLVLVSVNGHKRMNDLRNSQWEIPPCHRGAWPSIAYDGREGYVVAQCVYQFQVRLFGDPGRVPIPYIRLSKPCRQLPPRRQKTWAPGGFALLKKRIKEYKAR